MKKRCFAAALALMAALGGGMAVRAAVPERVAVNRCNSQTVDDAYGRVRDDDRHPSGASERQLLKRYAELAELVSTLNEEREILDGVCTNEATRDSLFAETAATVAWALTLQADVAGPLNASCPAAAQGLPRMMLADAWLTLANIANDRGGSLPQIDAAVVPKIQTRAQALGLVLPAWADTSAYWRDGINTKEKAAIATCPSPTPSP